VYISEIHEEYNIICILEHSQISQDCYHAYQSVENMTFNQAELPSATLTVFKI